MDALVIRRVVEPDARRAYGRNAADRPSVVREGLPAGSAEKNVGEGLVLD
jgi:hypothetical protein